MMMRTIRAANIFHVEPIKTYWHAGGLCTCGYLFSVGLHLSGRRNRQQQAGSMCPRSDGPVHACWTFGWGPSPQETGSGRCPRCSLATVLERHRQAGCWHQKSL